MKKLLLGTSVILILNLFLGVFLFLEYLEITDLLNDYHFNLIAIAFCLTSALWNFTSILDKKKNKN